MSFKPRHYDVLMDQIIPFSIQSDFDTLGTWGLSGCFSFSVLQKTSNGMEGLLSHLPPTYIKGLHELLKYKSKFLSSTKTPCEVIIVWPESYSDSHKTHIITSIEAVFPKSKFHLFTYKHDLKGKIVIDIMEGFWYCKGLGTVSI